MLFPGGIALADESSSIEEAASQESSVVADEGESNSEQGALETHEGDVAETASLDGSSDDGGSKEQSVETEKLIPADQSQNALYSSIMPLADEADSSSTGAFSPLPGYETDAALVAGGHYTDTIDWAVYDDNTLAFTGSGVWVQNYTAPWEYADTVTWTPRFDVDKPINIYFGEGITQIDAHFYSTMEYHTVGTLTLPSTLEYIGTGFEGFSITAIVAPESCPLWDGTFLYGDSSHTVIVGTCGVQSGSSLVIPEDVQTLGMCALGGLDLDNLYIPSTLETIESNAASNLYGTKSVIRSVSLSPDNDSGFWIDNTVGSSTYGSLMQPTGKVAISVSTEVYQDERGVIYSQDRSRLISAPASLSGSYTIDGSCIAIADGAFRDCASLTSVTIPDSITSIPADAFNGCTALTSVSLPSGLESVGVRAFQNCMALTSVVLPNTVTTLGNYAFDGCSSLETAQLSSSLTSMGLYSFQNCTSLKTVIMPDGMTDIGAFAFNGCTSLTAVALPNTITYIDVAAFANTGLTSFTAPSSLWANVSSMDKFSGDSDGIWGSAAIFTSTPANVFKPSVSGQKVYCDSIVTVDLSNYQKEYIPTYMFMGLTALTEVSIPSNVRIIDSGAFFECVSLKDVYCYSQNLSIAGAKTAGDASLGWSSTAWPAFTHWTQDASGNYVVDSLTGLNLYGLAYASNDLIEYAENNDCNFIPFVVLDNYDTTALFGHQITGYSNLTIDDMVYTGKALTPQVRATFTDVDLTDMERVLTDGDGVSIVYKDAGGNTISEIVAPGTYTAEITGDGQSVFGTKTLTFRVIDPNQETVVPGDGQQTGDDQQTGDGQQGGITQQAGYNAAAPAATTQAAAAQMPQTGDDSGNVGAFAALAGAAGAVAAGVAALRTRRKDDAAR